MNTTTTSPTDRSTWGEREYRLALTVWAEPDNTELGEWIERVAEYSDTPVLELITGISDGSSPLAHPDVAHRLVPRMSDTAALEHAFTWLATHPDIRFLIPGDPDWPGQDALDDLHDRPYGLWVRGDASVLSNYPRICMDGARASTRYGDQIATDLATDLTTYGYTVITGPAHGIQRSAATATLARGGAPVLVVATGIDRIHSDLIERTAAVGVIVSELPPGATPTKSRLHAASRTLAGLADATVIVEASIHSPSLHTARHADLLLRPVGVVPGPITSPASAGCHELLRSIDTFLVTGAQDIILEIEG